MQVLEKLLSFENIWMNGFVLKLLATLSACVFVVLLFRFVSYLWNHPFLKPCTLPGLKALQLAIYATVMKSLCKNTTDAIPTLCITLQMLCGYCKVFEKKRIFRFYIGFKPIVVFFKPETVEVVLNSSVIIDKAAEYDYLHKWLGTGLLTSGGDKWRNRRKMLTPAFHLTLLEEFIPVYSEKSNIFKSRLKSLSKEPFIDIVPMMAECTLDIICDTIMGIHIGAQSGEYNDYVQAVLEVGDMFYYRAMRPWLRPNFFFNFCGIGKKFNKHIKRIHELTRTVIKEKKANLLQKKKLKELNGEESAQSNGDSILRKKRYVLLELLLEQHFNDPSFTEEDIREEVDTFLFEGHDTTAMAMSWSLYFLGLYDDVQKKVHEELDEIFKGDIERDITREDINQLKYLECVIKETLRLHPSVPAIGREVKESFKVLNHTIHKGSVCLILPMALHQDPTNFKNPEKFIPERFLSENWAERNPHAYVPFSAGPRNCIGRKFALLEMKTVLANVLREYRVTSLDARDKANMCLNLIIKNVHPIRLRFTQRE